MFRQSQSALMDRASGEHQGQTPYEGKVDLAARFFRLNRAMVCFRVLGADLQVNTVLGVAWQLENFAKSQSSPPSTAG